MRKTRPAFQNFIENHTNIAMITVDQIHGSTPRDQGTWMLVSDTQIYGTIGGGQLENIAINHARDMLSGANDAKTDMQIPLGPHIGQCCGGVVNLKFEILDEAGRLNCEQIFIKEIAAQPNIYIFGAGHVGKALAESVSLLPFNTMLIDSRNEELDQVSEYIQTHLTALPESIVREAKANSVFIIMTHDHSLDFLITKEALERDDAAYVGMIGSKTKRATFKNWLKRESGSELNHDRLVCPIGNVNVYDKRPEIIAAFVTTQVLEQLHKIDRTQVQNELGALHTQF
ncbi:xanthine dehydrogenase accessory protein XdhC [Lentilitoribacter sp. EG35]|jgi:xanthine dehydrogenase accessory factor|uniref:xanthine dehydrogenase accessory protein XdhC n=1 Tax=Lentilitoribacter sp. EG35 TaxID=3234192 RepID=UPI0034609AB9